MCVCWMPRTHLRGTISFRRSCRVKGGCCCCSEVNTSVPSYTQLHWAVSNGNRRHWRQPLAIATAGDCNRWLSPLGAIRAHTNLSLSFCQNKRRINAGTKCLRAFCLLACFWPSAFISSEHAPLADEQPPAHSGQSVTPQCAG